MFLEIYTFELKNKFKRPAPYIFFGVFFLMFFLVGCVMGGAFPGIPSFFGKTVMNSPLSVASSLMGSSSDLIGLIILTAIMAPAIYQDFKYGVHSLLFTKPITKFSYFYGRFCAAFTIALFVLSGSYLGFLLVEFMPFADPERFGEFKLFAYVKPFLMFTIPNTLIMGGILFSVVTFTRNLLFGYLAAVGIAIATGISNSLLIDIDNRAIASLLDPSGMNALNEITRYWTIHERNLEAVPLSGVLLGNRIIWFAIGISIIAFSYFKFGFAQFASGGSKKVRKLGDRLVTVYKSTTLVRLKLPEVAQNFSFKAYLGSFWTQVKLEFGYLVKNVAFIVIMIIGVIALLVSAPQMGKIYDTATYPVTYNVLSTAYGAFQIFILLIIVFFAGSLVWKERDAKVSELLDATPLPNWYFFGSKFSALMMVQVLLLVFIMIVGLLIQTFQGYYTYEVGHYIQELFGIRFIGLAIVAMLALFIQTLFNNKYLGYFMTIVVLMIIPMVFGLMNWNHQLYSFNSSGPGLRYSDMNGYGHYFSSFTWFKLYWGAFAVLMFVCSILFWIRGKNTGLKQRWQVAKYNLNPKRKMVLISALAVFILSGGFIFYNTNIVNSYSTSSERVQLQVDYEKKYKQYESIPQPRFTGVNLKVDLYPYDQKYNIKGALTLKNKTNTPIKDIHFNINTLMVNNQLELSVPAEITTKDDDIGYYIFTLEKALQPGDSIDLNIDLLMENKGFRNSGNNMSIVYNGTFINSQGLPSIGYNPQGELGSPSERKKQELPPKERMAEVTDMAARQNTYIAHDADWVTFEVVVSTVPEQIAIAPGYLQREWEENGRRYFHYKMDAPILNFYSFLSAEYEIARDVWNGPNGEKVNLEVYYHKGHEYNIERMLGASKKSLDYYVNNFSPYQHSQVRILEFPRYATFAQSFPNTIPFSEGIGFIADIDSTDEDVIDYPFYVTAHEIAHQWWAHQVIGANVKGCTVMSETLSQYSSLMVMKKEYGEEKMHKFLKHEMDSYLSGRARESRKEQPLLLCENQQYIHYNKGSVVMYALQDFIGEDSVNIALSRYIDAVAFQEPPYTTSMEFKTYLEAVTPDSLSYLITDMFETITLYDNSIDTLYYDTLSNGKYEVTLTLDCKKVRADDLGKEEEVGMNDWIDIGLYKRIKDGKFRKKTVPMYLERHKIVAGMQDIKIIVDTIPYKAGLDPNYILIDRKPSDNHRVFGSSKSKGLFGDMQNIEVTIGG